jgi:potassium-transporting ATPase KdpC subunit
MFRQLRPAIVSVLVLMVFTGLVFPFVITAVAQAAFHYQANGSLIEQGGKVVGSELIGQPFTKPEYFHPRPSAAGSGYDPNASGGTNLGPTSSKLIQGIPDDPKTKADESYPGIKQLAEAYRKENNMPADAPVPADAVTRSASGLDPEISPANAALQAPRVAQARHMTTDAVLDLVHRRTAGRDLGFLGEPRVNVLLLNLDLDKGAAAKP